MTRCPCCRQAVAGLAAPLFDAERGIVSFNNKSAHLSPTESAIYFYLSQQWPRACANRAIEWRVWRDRDIDAMSSLKVHIYNLRRKLAPLGVRVENTYARGNESVYWLEW